MRRAAGGEDTVTGIPALSARPAAQWRGTGRAGVTEDATAAGGCARERLVLDRPGIARVHDYLLGGKDNYAADRALARRVLQILPQAAESARASRAFLGRAVRALTARGVRQFVDLGCGLPAAVNLHQIAARHAAARVVYVDDDPLVIAHARALLIRDGDIAALKADIRDPERVLASPEMRRLIDPREPVALVFCSVLHFLDDPSGPVTALTEAAPPGSAVVVSHATADFTPAVTEAALHYGEAIGVPLLPRPAAEVGRLLGGFTPLGPGVVPVERWRPDAPPRAASPLPPYPPVMYGAVGVLGSS
ncbi:SAM-dependent methyltransferase [Actinomadura roseirufa]|uniref:SAM-dependent methyltransferase n=1 Tax=Actinomadura roseirufa TaxID=2094049 RepID=UPI0013F14B15|nr:SAM-dependent methyltransferase [Actinomadura roseirufa]